jgi:hypothetical protein
MPLSRGITSLAAVALLVGLPGRSPLAADPPAAVAERELLAELQAAPRENEERVRTLRALYEQAGARPEEISCRRCGPGDTPPPLLHNVIVTKPGATDAVIVVGGHLDKVPPGDGVIDDWSGACLATNLYQTFGRRGRGTRSSSSASPTRSAGCWARGPTWPRCPPRRGRRSRR